MTILNQTPIIQMAPNWEFTITLIIITAVVVFLGFLITGFFLNFDASFPLGIIAIGLLITALILYVIAPSVETGRYEYEVIIDEQTPLVEIYDKYEVIERRGDIWELKDKEIEE